MPFQHRGGEVSDQRLIPVDGRGKRLTFRMTVARQPQFRPGQRQQVNPSFGPDNIELIQFCSAGPQETAPRCQTVRKPHYRTRRVLDFIGVSQSGRASCHPLRRPE